MLSAFTDRLTAQLRQTALDGLRDPEKALQSFSQYIDLLSLDKKAATWPAAQRGEALRPIYDYVAKIAPENDSLGNLVIIQRLFDLRSNVFVNDLDEDKDHLDYMMYRFAANTPFPEQATAVKKALFKIATRDTLNGDEKYPYTLTETSAFNFYTTRFMMMKTRGTLPSFD